MTIDDILKAYGPLLESVDEWFARSAAAAGSSVACRAGCSGCCRGLFDITLLDACYLQYGFNRLDDCVKRRVLEKAGNRLADLGKIWPEFAHPYILNTRPEEDWPELMPEEDETPCVLLDEAGNCLLYGFRPMTCRLHGIPLVDVSGELFADEWCSLNFVEENPLVKDNLRWQFRELFNDEMVLFGKFTELLAGAPRNQLDTIIPAALALDFRGFDWKRWLGSTSILP